MLYTGSGAHYSPVQSVPRIREADGARPSSNEVKDACSHMSNWAQAQRYLQHNFLIMYTVWGRGQLFGFQKKSYALINN
jgi:hypothetical protein